jgi:sugar phosphate isomerase/epimerase
MARSLGIHHITAIEVELVEFVKIAAASGCNQISLITYSEVALPGQKSRALFPTITPDMKHAALESLADNGVSVQGIEFFDITAEADVADYVPALALSRELGGVRAVTHIHDTDSARAVDKLGALCDVAAAEGLTLAIEFMGLTPACDSLERAVWFVDQVGKPTLGIGVDCLHLVRTGGTAVDIARHAARYFSYAQICDGHGLHRSSGYWDEAGNRELPGAGDFPLVEIISALPAGVTLEVELPSANRLKAGVPAQNFVPDAVSRRRDIVRTATPRL